MGFSTDQFDELEEVNYVGGKTQTSTILDSIIAQSLFNQHIIQVVDKFLGRSIFQIRVDSIQYFKQKIDSSEKVSYKEVFQFLLQQNLIGLGLYRYTLYQNRDLNYVYTNPEADTEIRNDDKIFVLNQFNNEDVHKDEADDVDFTEFREFYQVKDDVALEKSIAKQKKKENRSEFQNIFDDMNKFDIEKFDEKLNLIEEMPQVQKLREKTQDLITFDDFTVPLPHFLHRKKNENRNSNRNSTNTEIKLENEKETTKKNINTNSDIKIDMNENKKEENEL